MKKLIYWLSGKNIADISIKLKQLNFLFFIEFSKLANHFNIFLIMYYL